MDPHHADISIGLYVHETPHGPRATVHSYSRAAGTSARLAQVAETICKMAGLRQGQSATEIEFTCGSWHSAAARRLFLEACKQRPGETPAAPVLESPDTRTGQTIVVSPLGDGAYHVDARDVGDDETSRAPAITRAIAKLAELELDDGLVVRFPCRRPHDELIALLLTRAQNLRAILREEELQASRGVLAAPSGQE